MNDSSNFGADFHCDPNSIITLKGEDLPQPRNGAPETTNAYVSQLRTDPYAANLVLAVPGISTSPNAELVTNGTFDTDVSGWTITAGSAPSSSISWVGGSVQIIRGTGTGAGNNLYQSVTVEVGKSYVASVLCRGTVSGTQTPYLYVGTTAGNDDLLTKNRGSDFSGTLSGTFTATATTVYVAVAISNYATALFDNVSIREVEVPTDYSADIKGSGTNKTLTANGNAGVGYENPSYYGSALSFDGSGDYLDAGSSSDFDFGSGDFTVEFWQNANSFSSSPGLGIWDNTNNQRSWLIYNGSTNGLARFYVSTDGSSSVNANTTQPIIPTNQWTHFCMERNGSNLLGYVNGVCVGINTNLGTQSLFTPADPLWIGRWSTNYFNGYIQDLRIYKGVAKYKGGFDVPKPYTPVGIGTWRAVPDTTANNFATWNPISPASDTTFTNGNLTVAYGSASSRGVVTGTIGIAVTGADKYYWENHIDTSSADSQMIGVWGLSTSTTAGNYPGFTNSYGWSYYGANGRLYYATGNPVSNRTYGATYTAGDIIGVSLDMTASNGTLTFYKNGVSQGVATTGLGTFLTNGNIHALMPAIGDGGSTSTYTVSSNFGQNPTFSGTITAGTYTDSNGKGLFKYEPPSGFLALCEDNLPTPAISDPGEYFKTILYTGDSNSGRSIVGVGFTPDLVWVKHRNTAGGHGWFDSVRGPGLRLDGQSTGAETSATGVMSFDSDGFSLGSTFNTTNIHTVAWCWKAGAGTTTANTAGSIPSVVSANQTAGFSIVSYTGNGTNATVGHGLNKTPKFIIIKNRDASVNWIIYHSSVGATQYLRFTSNASTSQSSIFNDTEPTSSVFSLGSSTTPNGNGQKQIAYCWAEIEGFSKFGSYVGNNNADGPFVYCGFKPAVVIIKQTDGTGDWYIFDSSRGSTNPNEPGLVANQTAVETSYTGWGDFLSNGFKIRRTDSAWNGSGNSYIFAAFGESPFQTANAK